MKIRIAEDEAYPVFFLHSTFGIECDVSAEVVKRWKRVIKMYNKVQQEMDAAASNAARNWKEDN